MHCINSECTSHGAAETLGGAEVSWLVYPNFNVNLKIIICKTLFFQVFFTAPKNENKTAEM